MTDEITITIPASEAAQRHIVDLQATATKRNEQIEKLLLRVEAAESGEPNQQKLTAAYQRGWQAAAQLLMGTTQAAARELGRVHRDAWEIYLQAERRDFTATPNESETK